MSYLGSWKIDDLLTFYCTTSDSSTGAATDADSVPTYRIYEDETGTPILTGSMALLDDVNTTGVYSEQITLSAANELEKGKCYFILKTVTVNGVTSNAPPDTFQIEAEVDITQSAVNAIWDEVLDGSHNIGNSAGRRLRQIEDLSFITEGTAAGGSSETVELNGNAVAEDNYYLHTMIVLTSGPGAEQVRTITGYDGATRIATVYPDFIVDPDDTTGYSIFALTLVHTHVDEFHDGAITADAFASSAIAAFFDFVVEGAYTVKGMLRIMFAVLAGKSTGSGTTTQAFRNVADNKDRVSATVVTGNRTDISLDQDD